MAFDPRDFDIADEWIDRALELAPAERRAFVQRAGLPPDVAAYLQRVIEEASRQDGFLEPAGAIEGPLFLEFARTAEAESGPEAPGLAAGTQVGVYVVGACLGRGGMGEVYRARDTRLGRDVALKVLPGRFAADEERLERLRQEAQVLASISHPHIATIYGLEEHDGVVALALELVEGPTLAARLREGPLPLDEVLRLGSQIAAALEAAHARGIVHRDLKPGNITLTADGAVKVLDFGLALSPERVDSDGARRAVTETTHRTTTREAPGAVAGTAAYMSPEQARGQPVDARADLWAFGCVLYEMLVGRRAFGGATVTEILAQVLEREPDFGRLPRDTPPALERLVRRCLRKDPATRLRDAGDARLDLEEAVRQGPRAWRAGTLAARGRAWATLAAGLVLVSALAWSVKAPVAPAPDPPRLARLAIPVPFNDALVGGDLPSVAISPDGRAVVYRAVRQGTLQLFRRALDEAAPVALEGTSNATGPFLSEDGRWVAFEHDGRLMKAALSGGPAVPVCAAAGGVSGAWGPDDTILFSTATDPVLQRVPARGGEPVRVTTLDPSRGEVAHAFPAWLPGGQAALFTVRTAEKAHVAVLRLDSGATQLLLEGRQPHYLPSGHLVFYRDGALWTARFDLRELVLAGDPVPVVQEVAASASSGHAHFALSRSGSLVYLARTGTRPARYLAWVDRAGRESPLDVQPRAFTRLALSRDGARAAVGATEPEGPTVWLLSLARGTLTRFGAGPAAESAPIWAPDGRTLIFRSERQGGGLVRAAADGTGAAERVTATGGPIHTPYDVTPDGRTLLFSEFHSYRDQRIGRVALDGQSPPEWLSAGGFAQLRPQLSPDGRWLAYQSDESGRFEIYVRPYADLESGRWQASDEGGTSPMWGPDGRELFYYHEGALMRVPVARGTTFVAGRPAALFRVPQYGERLGPSYGVSPEGRRFLVIRDDPAARDGASRGQIMFVQHWVEELSRLVP
jgi:eukaryotic-like serine/threonine-protein kinase